MLNSNSEPVLRKETKLSCLTLFWPVTKNIGKISIYRFDTTGMRLIRVLHGCKVVG